ncbi:MAG: 30S ribosomal protein S20 [Candidatus Omnitrophota bacterium]
MAHRRSSIKKIRIDERRQFRNNRVRSQIKTAARKVKGILESKDASKADQTARLLFSELDKAVKKGVINKNRASRTRSRIQLRVNALLKTAK